MTGKRNALEYPEVRVLVAEVKELSMDENAAQTRSQKAAVKPKLSGRCRELTTILRKKSGQDLEKRIAVVEAVKNEGRKMFAALRTPNIRPPNELTIIDVEGKVVYRLKTQIDMLTFHFKCLFASDGVGNLTQHHATLQHPISAMEVQTTAAKLKNRCTLGPDLVSNELRSMLTSQTTSQWAADLSNLVFNLLNAALEGSINFSILGTGTLNALQKPNKPR